MDQTPRRRWLRFPPGRLMTVVVAAVLIEAAARAIVLWQWEPEKTALMTHHLADKGRYTSHSNLPYVLNPHYKGHNSYGFKGPEFALAKRHGVARVVAMGGSTTYGLDKPYALFLEESLNAAGIPAEVLNAGVPGWAATENLVNLSLKILPLQPDLVIYYEGRNELLPQAYNGFKSDQSHYRRSDYSFQYSNYLFKFVNRASYAFMILSRYRGDRFGWSSIEEHPVYGTIRYENRPSAQELIANLRQDEPTLRYRETLAQMATLVKSRGAGMLFATMAFIPERITTDGILTDEPSIFRALGEQLDRNNDAMREVAARMKVAVVETATLRARADLFQDDCHMSDEGHRLQANLMLKTIVEAGLLQRSTASPPDGQRNHTPADRSHPNGQNH